MEAGVLRCASCGASVPANAPQCPYCQAQLASVACPACLALVPLSASHCPGCGALLAPRASSVSVGAACPACRKPLVTSRIGQLDAEACQACGGLWLDRAVFEQLAASREGQGAVMGVLPAPAAPPVVGPEPVKYRPCPVCHQLMNRLNYARHSGVILDVCKTHGIWFDLDELRRVLAFITGGGLDRARDAELAELKEAQRDLGRAPEHTTTFFESSEQMNTSGRWLTGAGLLGLAADLAGMFLPRD